MKLKLILDVETTGLPNRYLATGLKLPFGQSPDPKDLKKYDSARVIQFTMLLCDEKFNALEEKDFIIKKTPEINIKNSHIHGITNEISLSSGIPFPDVANEFFALLVRADTIIAHNADFDINVIKSELYRYSLDDIYKEMELKRIVCTMKETTNMLNIIRNGFYSPKAPSLKELYEFVMNEPIQNQHNSLYDVRNLHKIVKTLHDGKDERFPMINI